MSIFDGMTALFEGVFDCAVILLLPDAEDVAMRGIFREEPFQRTDLDGNDITVVQPTLKLRAAHAALVSRGSRLTVESRPGEAFKVVAKHPTRSPATDRHFLLLLTEDYAP
jgi:hypothetical protein